MPFQPVTAVALARMVFAYDTGDREYMCGMYFFKAGGWTGATTQALADRFAQTIEGTLMGFVPTGAKLLRTEARDLTSEFNPTYENISNTAGTLDTTWSSPNNAAVINFTGTPGSPPRRGRIFWPFVAESWVSQTGQVTSNITTDLKDFIEDLAADIESNQSCVHVIVSRRQGNEVRDPAVYGTVTGYAAMPIVASQRDRRDRN